jgi:hypothetical protein
MTFEHQHQLMRHLQDLPSVVFLSSMFFFVGFLVHAFHLLFCLPESSMHGYMLCGAVGRLSGCMNSFVVQILLKHKQQEAISWKIRGKRSMSPAGN